MSFQNRKLREELLALKEESLHRQQGDPLLSYSLHKKQQEFYEAMYNGEYREGWALWANRAGKCISFSSPVEMAHATAPISTILGETSFDVQTWDGNNRCTRKASGLFLKGIEPALRIYLDNGQVFECTYMHRVLTDEGWAFVGSLLSSQGDQHLWERGGDYSASYDKACRQYGLPPQMIVGNGTVKPLKVGDVLKRNPTVPEHMDVMVPTPERIHTCLASFPHSSPDDPDLLAALFALWPTRSFYTSAVRKNVQRLAETQPVAASIPALAMEEFQGIQDPEAYEHAYYSLALPIPLFGDVQIIGYQKLGLRPIVDFTVEETHCYYAGGAIHHNSDVGAYLDAKLLRHGWPDHLVRSSFSNVNGASIEVRDRAVSMWVVSQDFPASRDIMQPKLFDNGFVPPGQHEPFIPEREINEWRVSDQILKLKNGSICGFKSCFVADTPVHMEDGTWRAIRDIKEGDKISVTNHFGRGGIQTKQAEVIFSGQTGTRETVKLSIKGGREIICTPDHEFFDGLRWRQAKDFKPGDKIPYYGVPEPEEPKELPINPWLLGFLVGDGCFRGRQVLASIHDALIMKETERLLARCGAFLTHRGGKGDYAVSVGRHAGGGRENPILNAVKCLGLWDHLAKDKFVPDKVFQSSDEDISEFLSGLFAADGTLTKKPSASLTTSSERLARGVQRLFDRLGIKTAVWYVKSTDSWRVVTQGKHALAEFLDRVRWIKYPEKAKALRGTLPIQPKQTPFRVKSVEPYMTLPVYDITCPVSRCFNVSGLVAHNCDSPVIKFYGAGKDVIHFDEEPPKNIFDESVIRIEAGRRLVVYATCTLLPPQGESGGVSWIFGDRVKKWKAGKLPPDVQIFTASIYDNPHLGKEELKHLESIYPEGSTNRRIRLDGELLPGMGGSRAYGSFDADVHVRHCELDNRFPLAWCWDFNVEPMITHVGQYRGGVFYIPTQLHLESGAIPDMCDLFYDKFYDWPNDIIIFGDATGQNRTGQTGITDYKLILNHLRNHRVNARLRVPTVNPTISERLGAVNRSLRNEQGEVTQIIDPSCEELIADYEEVLMASGGGIKKSNNNKDPYYKRTHASDGVGYWIFQEAPVRLKRRTRNFGKVTVPDVQYKL